MLQNIIIKEFTNSHLTAATWFWHFSLTLIFVQPDFLWTLEKEVQIWSSYKALSQWDCFLQVDFYFDPWSFFSHFIQDHSKDQTFQVIWKNVLLQVLGKYWFGLLLLLLSCFKNDCILFLAGVSSLFWFNLGLFDFNWTYLIKSYNPYTITGFCQDVCWVGGRLVVDCVQGSVVAPLWGQESLWVAQGGKEEVF